MNIQLKPLEEQNLETFREELKMAFEKGVLDRFGTLDAAPIPPADEVDEALKDPCFDVFLVLADGVPAGGAIVKKKENKRYSLDLFFIFREFLNQKIGSAAWRVIEAHYPDASVWETHTPYFERRNIHFYLKKCGFKIVEFFTEFHPEEHDISEEFKDKNTSGFFRFEKIMDS